MREHGRPYKVGDEWWHKAQQRRAARRYVQWHAAVSAMARGGMRDGGVALTARTLR